MEYKLLGLEMITKVKERYYRKGLQKRMELFCNYLNMQAIAQDASSVVPTFSRSLPKNLQELAATLSTMRDFVSMKTLIKQIPFVEDPDAELEEVKEEKAEAVRQQQELFAQGANTPPEDDEEGQQDNKPKEKPEEEEE